MTSIDFCSMGVRVPCPTTRRARVCDELHDLCDWSVNDRCNCRSACENELMLEGDCQEPLDALAACAAQADAWSCDGSLDGCASERDLFRKCTSGQSGVGGAKRSPKGVGSWTRVGDLPRLDECGCRRRSGVGLRRCGRAGRGRTQGFSSARTGRRRFTAASAQFPDGAAEWITEQEGTIYAVFDMLLYASEDSGATWTQTGPDMIFGSSPVVGSRPVRGGDVVCVGDGRAEALHRWRAELGGDSPRGYPVLRGAWRACSCCWHHQRNRECCSLCPEWFTDEGDGAVSFAGTVVIRGARVTLESRTQQSGS